MRVQRCVSPVHAVVSMSTDNNNSSSTNNNSKVLKNSNRSECPQILMYLQRLQHLVPTCPKDRPVNKLELIQYVIDYIYDLEHVLNTSDSETDDSMDSS